jgi:hypothetical protein
MNTNRVNPPPPAPILAAIDHVRQFHPEVDMVVFNDMGRWQFMGEDFERVKFGEFDPTTGLYGGIGVGILEAAADEANAVFGLPAVWQAYTSAEGIYPQEGEA